jgi:hypothetical protein
MYLRAFCALRVFRGTHSTKIFSADTFFFRAQYSPAPLPLPTPQLPLFSDCWGGHGRTGTVVSIMLGIMYGASPVDAMRWVQFCHDLRVAPMGVPSPQTETQRQQVIRILNTIQRGTAPPRSLGDAAAPAAAPGSPRNQSGKSSTSAARAGGGAGASPHAAARATSAAVSRAGGGGGGGGSSSGGAGMSATTRPVSAVTAGSAGAHTHASSPQAARGGAAGKWPIGGVTGKAAGGGGSGAWSARAGAAAASPGGTSSAKNAATLVAQAYGDASGSALAPAPGADGRASPPMEHLSPRPASVASVEGAGDATSGFGGGGGSGVDNSAPRSFTSAILEDKIATAVAPLASSSGTVLGVAPLSLTQRKSAAAAVAQYSAAAPRNPPPVIVPSSAARALFSQTAGAGFAAAAGAGSHGARTIPAAERLGATVAAAQHKSGFRSVK